MKFRLTSAIIKTIILLIALGQFAHASRKFLTGLIIGTLLARNGMQQSPMYPMPYPSSSNQQQPLFIIIPSTSGKSHKPHIVPASQYASRSYTDSVPYPQNLLLRRSLIRNKPTKYPQKRPSKRQFLLDKLKHQVDSGGKATSASPSELVVLSERASDLSLVPTKIRSSAGKRQASPMLDDFQTTSVQADWASDK